MEELNIKKVKAALASELLIPFAHLFELSQSMNPVNRYYVSHYVDPGSLVLKSPFVYSADYKKKIFPLAYYSEIVSSIPSVVNIGDRYYTTTPVKIEDPWHNKFLSSSPVFRPAVREKYIFICEEI